MTIHLRQELEFKYGPFGLGPNCGLLLLGSTHENTTAAMEKLKTSNIEDIEDLFFFFFFIYLFFRVFDTSIRDFFIIHAITF